MSDAIERFQRVLKKIDTLKERQATLEGQKKELLSQLSEDFGVNSLSEAVKLYKKLQGEVQEEENEIESSVYKIEELLNDIYQ